MRRSAMPLFSRLKPLVQPGFIGFTDAVWIILFYLVIFFYFSFLFGCGLVWAKAFGSHFVLSIFFCCIGVSLNFSLTIEKKNRGLEHFVVKKIYIFQISF